MRDAKMSDPTDQADALRNGARVQDVVPDERIEPSADTTAVWKDSAQTLAALVMTQRFLLRLRR